MGKNGVKFSAWQLSQTFRVYRCWASFLSLFHQIIFLMGMKEKRLWPQIGVNLGAKNDLGKPSLSLKSGFNLLSLLIVNNTDSYVFFQNLQLPIYRLLYNLVFILLNQECFLVLESIYLLRSVFILGCLSRPERYIHMEAYVSKWKIWKKSSLQPDLWWKAEHFKDERRNRAILGFKAIFFLGIQSK